MASRKLNISIPPEGAIKTMLAGNKVLVTGGGGFLGKHLSKELESKGCLVQQPNRENYLVDLTNYQQCIGILMNSRPDYVIHAAGYNGGIEFNRLYPADIYTINTEMAINIFRAISTYNKWYPDRRIKKVVSLLASCAYPTNKDLLHEEDLWSGPCNTSVECHGLAKRNLQVLSKTYNTQYGLNAVCFCLTNLYGPGDRFSFDRTKVVGAIIRRVWEAKQENKREIECWGTGKPLRELMYVKDAAKAISECLEVYSDSTKPLNIGSGCEVCIKELVTTVCELVGYTGEVKWLVEKGDGQMRKLLDTSTMRQLLPNIDITNFRDGLMETIDWYSKNWKSANER